jgi:hypothetical protein
MTEVEGTDAARLQVKRWRRYGKDYLYVSGADGSKVGRLDLQSGEVVLDQEERRAEFDAAVTEWRTAEGLVVPAPLSTPVPEPPPPAVAVEEPGWVDLAANRPGQAAREQALELKQQAPVRTFIARALNVHTDERAWRIGADGEQEVAWRLRKLDERWHLLHAIPVGENGSDIDHLACGPGGVFTLNTKNHPGGTVWVAERSLMVNGQRTTYLRNARFEATRAAKLLTAACGFDVGVEPIIVLLCAELTIKAKPEGVHIASARRIRKWLAKRPPVLETEQVQAIFEHARRGVTWRAHRD